MSKFKDFFGIGLWQSLIPSIVLVAIPSATWVWFRENFWIVVSVTEFFIILIGMLAIIRKKLKEISYRLDDEAVEKTLNSLRGGERDKLYILLCNQRADVFRIETSDPGYFSLIEKKVLLLKKSMGPMMGLVSFNPSFVPRLESIRATLDESLYRRSGY